MKFFLIPFLFFLSLQLFAQKQISGIIVNAKKHPIEGANVYLQGTYDGGTTNSSGVFSFKTNTVGKQVLIVSFVSYETHILEGDVVSFQNLNIVLKEDVSALDAVILSAGTFSAGDNSKVSVLKPLDIVTTAGAMGDFIGAFQTLPGTTTVAEDGRLFVRGGDANETQIFIDGMRVFTPYSSTPNNVPSRGRFSPFLFKGFSFSTGGYSAEFGQALSSVFQMNTIDNVDQEKTEIGVLSVGGFLRNTQRWKNNSISFNASYTNLAPYHAIFKDRNHWIKPFENISGESVFRHKTTNGLLKLYGAFDTTSFNTIQDDINRDTGNHLNLKANNLYFNGSYKTKLNASWKLFSGLSYTNAVSKIKLNESDIKDKEQSIHAKLKLRYRFNNYFKIKLGAEYFTTQFNENYGNDSISQFAYGFNNNISALFTEADVFISKNLAFKAGLRLEYNELFSETIISPRLSMGYKTSDKSQFSLAYGDFNQTPDKSILKFNQDFESQKSQHYILNYQYNHDQKLFRAEVFKKAYNQLVKYNTNTPSFNTQYDNSGSGYANGLDLFWRDGKRIKNMEYWLSYSFLDTERDYKNYPSSAQPNFTNTHNASVVVKYFITKWKSSVGLSHNFASGRTYTNPNQIGFLNSKTKNYNSLNLSWAYLMSPQKILYFSVNNVLNIKNINGYQYVNTPNEKGYFNRRELLPASNQFFVVGFFWTISDNKTDNQLNTL